MRHFPVIIPSISAHYFPSPSSEPIFDVTGLGVGVPVGHAHPVRKFETKKCLKMFHIKIKAKNFSL